MATKHQSKKRVRDDDSDTDSDNEMLMNSETNWPRFLIVESFCNSEGFSGYCLNPEEHQKTERWLLLGGVWQKGPGPNLLQTNRFIDRPVKVSIHKTLNSFRGVIRCRDLTDMSEVEIRYELRDQGVVGVNRVTLKKEGKVIPTNTLS